MATLIIVSIHTRCGPAGHLEPNLCLKFATNIPVSVKIVVFRENLGELPNLFPIKEARCLGEMVKFGCALGLSFKRELENLGG